MFASKKIVIWGTGNIARSFYYEKGCQYDIQYFIDNNQPKYKIGDLQVFTPDKVDLRRYKIVIATTKWKGIAEYLESCGLSFFEDYLPYSLMEIDEIPFMEILKRINVRGGGREKAVSAYQRGREIAFINGNCQTSKIKMYLQQNREFDSKFVFLDIPPLYLLSHKEIDLLMYGKDILSRTKLFISQNISLNNSFDRRFSNEYWLKLMDEKVQYIRIPNLFLDIYFPQGGKEQDPEKEPYVRNIFPYNDAIIDELTNKKGFGGEGYTTDEIVEIIEMDDFFTDDFLRWVIEYRFEQLREREKFCDIKMTDYIQERYLKEQIFYSRNHPTNKVLKEESLRILRYMGINGDIEEKVAIPELSVNQEFIYPGIYHKLHTAFKRKWYSDPLSISRNTLAEEIKKYLFCCHNKYFVTTEKRAERLRK